MPFFSFRRALKIKGFAHSDVDLELLGYSVSARQIKPVENAVLVSIIVHPRLNLPVRQ